jgi:catechol 2,3-dioxygenase-like lactoylglutathione lyase family enzyme
MRTTSTEKNHERMPKKWSRHESTALGLVVSRAVACRKRKAEGDEPLRQPHHVALRVPDPGAAVAALRAAGVPLRQVGPNLGFEDPEGAIFHFMSPRVG